MGVTLLQSILTPAAGVAAVTANTTDDGEIVVIEGLDADYNFRSTTVPVGAASPVVFSRIFRAYMQTTSNGADVLITQGGVVAAEIKATFGQHTNGYLHNTRRKNWLSCEDSW